LLRFAGMIPPDDIALMCEAIEQDCEQLMSMSGSYLLDTKHHY
jgi:hypothetical protein